MIFLTYDENCKQRAINYIKSMKKQGIKHIPFKFDYEGIKIENLK